MRHEEARRARFEEDFGRFICARQLIDERMLARASSGAKSTGARLDRVLVKLAMVPEHSVAKALAMFLDIELIEFSGLPAAPILAELINASFVADNQLIPIAVEPMVKICVVDPIDCAAIDGVAYATGRPVNVALITQTDFDRATEILYGQGRALVSPHAETASNEFDIARLRDLANDAPTVRLVGQLLAAGVDAKATDIHLEPDIDTVNVRFRVDGQLRLVQSLPNALRAAVTSRLKIIAKLDIAERRLPQDGRVEYVVQGRKIDLRLSTMPTLHGESLAIRILDRTSVNLDFDALGFSSQQRTSILKTVQLPIGIFLVTGPTGSGKTTTLYTSLLTRDHRSEKIFTVEDPVEYQIPGINQIQTHPTIGLDFPRTLRSLLRQDPDVIMIGEMRDHETATIAIQAALTGHFVLSTLHTNSAPGSITRLVDMGCEPFLLASTLKGVLAQRLVRKICQNCAEPHQRSDLWLAELRRRVPRIDNVGPPQLRQGTGCDHCRQTGFRGRTTIAEFMQITPRIQAAISAKVSEAELLIVARSEGMVPLFDDGAARAWRGEVNIDDVYGITESSA